MVLTAKNKKDQKNLTDSSLHLLELDPVEAERKKTIRSRRLNVIQIPTLRLLGFAYISFLVFLNNKYILGISPWLNYATLYAVVFFYLLFSWTILYFFFDKIKIHLGILFLAADIFIFILFIYYSGGEKTLIDFALRVTLSIILSRRANCQIQTIILDEPFGELDSVNRQIIVKAIKYILNKYNFKRIIVISHCEELQNMGSLENTIRVEFDGRKSYVK